MPGPPVRETVSDLMWFQVLGALVAVRVLIPLLVLAASPRKLPLLPAYDYVPLNGDAYGSYHAVANLFAAFSAVMLGWVGLGSLVLAVCFGAATVVLWRARIRWLALIVPAFGLSLVLGYLVHVMASSEAGVIGWSLVWALALSPLAILRIGLSPDAAFGPGLALGIIANSVTVIATAFVGLRATGRRSVGMLAAGLYATWPLWVGIVAGHRAWDNGQWFVDVGLHLYSEPLSTALVVVALALLLKRGLTTTSAALAGLLLGFSTAVKLPNGPIAAAIVVIVALHAGVRRAVIVALGGIATAPIVIGFWSNGYVDSSDGGGVDLGALYRWEYISHNLRASTIFTGAMLIVLVPPAIVGLFGVRDWYARAMLVAPIVVTFICFGAYYVTDQHPRFYYVILPAVFVLQAAGAVLIWGSVRDARLGAARADP